MCGLTGVAISPDASDAERTLAAVALNDLLLRTQARGRHATGLAAYFPEDKRVQTAKRAEQATAFVKRKEYETLLNALADGGVSHVIGHTRYATQGAAHLDENAHPFTFGAVTGAHNGIINNWRDIERDLRKQKHKGLSRGFQVDSEAVFALLDAHPKSPTKALGKLDGYFALTWLQGAHLYIARSTAPLTLVYVKAMRALFWNSEERPLKDVLGAHGIDIADDRACAKYDPTAGKVYRYTPALFTADGTAVAHCGEFKFAEPKRAIDYARPNAPQGGWSSTRRLAAPKRDGDTLTRIGERWDYDATGASNAEIADPLLRSLNGDRVYSFPELTRKLDEAGRRIIALEKRAGAQRDRIKTLEAQMQELRDYVGLEEALLDAEEASESGPYLDRDQLPLPMPLPMMSRADDLEAFLTEGGRCAECGFGSSPREPLLETAGGDYAHAACIAAGLVQGI